MTRSAVVIPCFNAAAWIGRAIRSVLDQSVSDLKIIVVDDGSSDSSIAAIENFGEAVILLSGPNRGACHARNKGFDKAVEMGAEYVLFLDADDYHEGPVLDPAIAIAERRNADLVLANMHIETEGNEIVRRPLYKGQIDPDTFFGGWMAGNYVNPSAILWRCRFLEEIGLWNEGLARAQDLEIVLRAMTFEPTIWKSEHGAAIHAQVNANSISRSQSERALRSRFDAVTSVLDRCKGTRFSCHKPALCTELYHIARAAFRANLLRLGREVLAVLSAEKFSDHPGTQFHAMAARAIGLETKVRLWRA